MTPEALALLTVAMQVFETCLANGISREDLVNGIDEIIEEQEARKDTLMKLLSENSA